MLLHRQLPAVSANSGRVGLKLAASHPQTVVDATMELVTDLITAPERLQHVNRLVLKTVAW